MRPEELKDVTQDFLAVVLDTLAVKNSAYAQPEVTGDVLHRFREEALELGISMETCWAVFFEKHRGALLTFIRGGDPGAPITRVLKDMVCYIILLLAILVDGGKVSLGDITNDGSK